MSGESDVAELGDLACPLAVRFWPVVAPSVRSAARGCCGGVMRAAAVTSGGSEPAPLTGPGG